MSVRVRNRTASNFETTDKALALATYTIDILDNSKTFDPKHERLIAQMQEEASMIYHKCRVANIKRVKPLETEEDRIVAKERLRLQMEAADLCEHLLSDIMISKKLFHLKASRVRYWGTLAKETEKLILSWHSSDKKRYRDYGL